MRAARLAVSLVLMAGLGNVGYPPVGATPLPGVSASQRALPSVSPGPSIDSLPISREQADRALNAFRLSCPSLLIRSDVSGLTQQADWANICAQAAIASDALQFFRTVFEAVQVGDGQTFATGYYEPEIAGSRMRDAEHQVPIFANRPTWSSLIWGAFPTA